MKCRERTSYEKTLWKLINKRASRLGDSVNDFLDRIYFDAKSIKQQIFSPIHGLDYDEFQALAKIVSDHFGNDYPDKYNHRAFGDAIDEAQRRGVDVPANLFIDYALLDEDEEVEVQYRVYAFLELKRILAEHFGQL